MTSEGYIDQTAAIIIEEGKPQIRNFELVKEGMTITLRGVYFDFDKATIKPASHDALADAAQILTDNPTINVEIQGHTDSKGSDEYNLAFRTGASWSVVNYLVQNFGIDTARLTAKGYGETMADRQQRHRRRPRHEPPRRVRHPQQVAATAARGGGFGLPLASPGPAAGNRSHFGHLTPVRRTDRIWTGVLLV